MNQDNLATLAKEAYVLTTQLEALHEEMHKATNRQGYQGFARSYNRILERAQTILKMDETMASSISHLTPFNPSDGLQGGDYNRNSDYSGDFENLKAETAVLKATLHSFFQFYLPPKDKEQIGFHAKE